MAARKTLLVLGFASACAAHMFIASPKPIRGSAPKDPLDPSGANFPCHGIQLPSSGGQEMKAGSHQLLAFDLGNGANTAVHGGGSCQISITYETDAVKQKNPQAWRVIYSIVSQSYASISGWLETYRACADSYISTCRKAAVRPTPLAIWPSRKTATPQMSRSVSMSSRSPYRRGSRTAMPSWLGPGSTASAIARCT